MKTTKESVFIIGALVISTLCLIAVGIVGLIEIDKRDKELKEKQQIIETQKIQIEDLRIDCKWLQAFYNDSVCEEGCVVAE